MNDISSNQKQTNFRPITEDLTLVIDLKDALGG